MMATHQELQNVAAEMAEFYRDHPTKWVRGFMGSKTHGCCLMGGVLETATTRGHVSFLGQFSWEFGKFLRATKRAEHGGVTKYNDLVAKDVNEVIDALEEFSRYEEVGTGATQDR